MSSETNGNSRKRAMDDALDRIVLGGSFLPAEKYEGSKEGYYFQMGNQGLGYYQDETAQAASTTDRPTKNKRPRVQIAEDQNTTRVMMMTPDQLLEQAEAKKSSGQVVVDLTVSGVKSAAKKLLQAVQTNSMQRAQYPNDPPQYMESELALYEHVSACQAFAADPVKLYPVCLQSKLLSTLLQLLLHDNTDLVSAVVSVLLEWLDPALEGVQEMAMEVLQEGGEFLVDNLGRLGDQDDQVGRGRQDVLELIEHLLEVLPDTASLALCRDTTLVSWLLLQVQSDEDPNRALELLALLAPREEVHTALKEWSKLSPYKSSLVEDEQEKEAPEAIDGIEILLQCIATFRKKQPADDSQLELLENACIVLGSCLTFSSGNAAAFLEGQGIELVLRCLKERVHAGGVALKLCDLNSQNACEHLVQAGALKYLIPMFMGRHQPKQAPVAAVSKKAKRQWQNDCTETTIRILYALVQYLRPDSPHDAQERLLAKFVAENDRCDRLVTLCIEYEAKARVAEYKFYRSDVEDELQDETELAALEAKLAGGGDIFHRLAALVAFLCVGSKRCHERILAQLKEQKSGMSLVKQGLEEFVSVLEESNQRKQLQGYLDKI